MDKDTTNKILSEIEKGYDSVADKFSSTRTFMWRDLDFIRDFVKPEDSILDFGCGNGRLAGYLKNKYKRYIGFDTSRKLINIAKEKHAGDKTEFLKLDRDFQALPLENNSMDAIISIAVFHHFPGKVYRANAAKELYRVLRPGGTAIITVWNLWQKTFWKYHFNAITQKLTGKSNLDWGDTLIPFKSNAHIFNRYHHAFRKEELVSLFGEAGFSKLKLSGGRNIAYIGRKSAVDK
ncbi:MAG: methyltransferase domain-containing protein [Parcubacteria group bacterium]|jgi:ubiquinone/menaquinone biosynthesis C-methylase UbiE